MASIYNNRLDYRAWNACPLFDAEVSVAAGRVLGLPSNHPVMETVCAAVFREIERLTVMGSGGFND